MEVPNNEENKILCICSSCPTFVAGDKEFYCSLGKSEMDVIKRGCICDECPLWSTYELSVGYFCTNGKAA